MRNDDLAKIKRMLTGIKSRGWIENRRPGNAGGVGNTLEDLLEVDENNLQLPDFGEWELKSQRNSTSSLLTLFHIEPNPRAARIVPQLLLPKYGWPHQEAGRNYPNNERSYRQTINTTRWSDRGFKIVIERESSRIAIAFDFSKIQGHEEWRQFIQQGIGTAGLNPTPYWDFADIKNKLDKKIKNLLYFRAENKSENGKEFFKYNNFEAYIEPTLEKFLSLAEEGNIYVDFDAKTGHNHGTKFRMKPTVKDQLYLLKIEE
ncbi:hypothetical protein FACS1894206_05050 [Deltaproteobacteria bacterium]|nr:hypothetical protein FACS1894206_05050 [Deltaproteobacteria bacterium]